MIFFSKPRYELLDEYVSNGDYDKALKAIAIEMRKKPEAFSPLMAKAEILSNAADRDGAIRIFRKLGQEFARDRLFVKSILLYKQILRLRPDFERAEGELAKLIEHHREVDPDSAAMHTPLPDAVDLDSERDEPSTQEEDWGWTDVGDDDEWGDMFDVMDNAAADSLLESAPPPEPIATTPAPAAPRPVAEPPAVFNTPAPPVASAAPAPIPTDSPFGQPAPPAPPVPAASPFAQAPEPELLPELEFTPEPLLANPFAVAVDPEIERAKEMESSAMFTLFGGDVLEKLLRSTSMRRYSEGDIIVTEGEPGQSMFLIASGSVKIFTRGQLGEHIHLANLATGDFFGEMSLLSGNPRNATITASSLVFCIEISRSGLNEIASEHPEVFPLLQRFHSERAQATASAVISSKRTLES